MRFDIGPFKQSEYIELIHELANEYQNRIKPVFSEHFGKCMGNNIITFQNDHYKQAKNCNFSMIFYEEVFTLFTANMEFK